ncbi:MAG: hypothetical protein ACYSTL_06850, partial [Planctomycetota bacterium]
MTEELRELAIRSLQRMYLPAQRLFAFRIRRRESGTRPEGVSRRYTAIALIGLSTAPQRTARRVLDGQDVHDICDALLSDLELTSDLGEVALSLW